jgi:hypothetical protein
MEKEKRERKQRKLEEKKKQDLIATKLKIRRNIQNSDVKLDFDYLIDDLSEEIQELKLEIQKLTAKATRDDLTIHTLQQEHAELLHKFEVLQESSAKSIIKRGGISG